MNSILQFHALSLEGKACTFEVSENDLKDLEGAINKKLIAAGFDKEELDSAIVSKTPIIQPKVTALPPQETKVFSLEEVAKDNSLPPIPKPATYLSQVPAQSESITVSNNPIGLFFQSIGKYLPVAGATLNPPFPQNCTIGYKRYWLNNFTQRIGGPQQFSHTVSSTKGMNQTDSTSLSAELGVAYGALSAKLTASTSHSITILESTATTNKMSVSVPSNKNCVFTSWQLVEEFVLLGPDGNPVNWSGKWELSKRAGILPPIWITASFPQHAFVNNVNSFASTPVFFDS